MSVSTGTAAWAAVAALALGSIAGAGPPIHDPPPLQPPIARSAASAPSPGPERVVYTWPVLGPLLRRFEPPGTAYGPGHRGIDIGAPPRMPVRAAASGTVAFAGRVAGSLFLSIDHPDGVRTTYSWLSGLLAQRGDRVAGGTVVARSGPGHPGSAGAPHLHLGARIEGTYIDPLLLLGDPWAAGIVHLAPVGSVEPRPPP